MRGRDYRDRTDLGRRAGDCPRRSEHAGLSPARADQLPDPKIEAVEGAGEVPAYRGTAYVVLEDLALGQFGNRVPQFSFEVMRPAQRDNADASSDLAHGNTAPWRCCPAAVNMRWRRLRCILSMAWVSRDSANVNSPSGKTDFATSLEAIGDELPNCASVSLIVSWFGDDLRCGDCLIQPKIEQAEFDGNGMPWQVAGATRSTAPLVARDVDDRPVYGGTPTDASVIEAIQALKSQWQAVMFYPFILMDQMAGNRLPDPYSDADDQPVLPWRGRINLSTAPRSADGARWYGGSRSGGGGVFGTAPRRTFIGRWRNGRLFWAGGVALSSVHPALCASLRGGRRG